MKRKFFVLILGLCLVLGLLCACGGTEHDKIVSDYNKSHGSNEQISAVKCYGEFGGAHVVSLLQGGAVNCVIGEASADGVDFHYNYAAYALIVWKGGDFYSLQGAFDAGILTHEDLLAVRETHKAEFPYMYTEDDQ